MFSYTPLFPLLLLSLQVYISHEYSWHRGMENTFSSLPCFMTGTAKSYSRIGGYKTAIKEATWQPLCLSSCDSSPRAYFLVVGLGDEKRRPGVCSAVVEAKVDNWDKPLSEMWPSGLIHHHRNHLIIYRCVCLLMVCKYLIVLLRIVICRAPHGGMFMFMQKGWTRFWSAF